MNTQKGLFIGVFVVCVVLCVSLVFRWLFFIGLISDVAVCFVPLFLFQLFGVAFQAKITWHWKLSLLGRCVAK